MYVLYIVYTNNENPFSVVPSSDISNHPQNTVLFPETEVNALCKSCQVGRQVGLHLGHHTAVEREDEAVSWEGGREGQQEDRDLRAAPPTE